MDTCCACVQVLAKQQILKTIAASSLVRLLHAAEAPLERGRRRSVRKCRGCNCAFLVVWTLLGLFLSLFLILLVQVPICLQVDSVLGLIARQGTVRGLKVVDLNFPQHFEGMSARGLRSALRGARLAAAAVNVRFPSTMRLGAFTNPEAEVRDQVGFWKWLNFFNSRKRPTLQRGPLNPSCRDRWRVCAHARTRSGIVNIRVTKRDLLFSAILRCFNPAPWPASFASGPQESTHALHD